MHIFILKFDNNNFIFPTTYKLSRKILAVQLKFVVQYFGKNLFYLNIQKKQTCSKQDIIWISAPTKTTNLIYCGFLCCFDLKTVTNSKATKFEI